MGLFKKRKPVPVTPMSPEQATLASVGLPVVPGALPSALTAHAEFVKRARCVRCGAPKTLPSVTAYLYCDYCGALVDYDFRLANAGTNAGITNTVYHQLVAPWQATLDQARAAGDRDTYRQIQAQVYRQWIDRCPQAVSPRARTDPEFRERMAAYSAECAVCKDFDPRCQQLDAQVNALIACFQRVPTGEGAWRVAGDFWTMAALWKQEMELAYAQIEATGVAAMDPDEAPPGVALKMEYSAFCQSWLPHLATEDGERLLAEFGLTGDYARVEPQPTEAHRCGRCGSELQTMPGARVVVCETCGTRVDIHRGDVPCGGCGAPLSYPVGIDRVQCPYCRTDTHRV